MYVSYSNAIRNEQKISDDKASILIKVVFPLIINVKINGKIFKKNAKTADRENESTNTLILVLNSNDST